MRIATSAAAALALSTAACSQHASAGGPPAGGIMPALAERAAARPDIVQHVVVIVQENRSFDNLFYQYPGADTVLRGKNSKGQTILLHPVPLGGVKYDVEHLSSDFFAACDGSPIGQNCKMDGFDKEVVGGQPPPNPQYAYVPQTETQPYFALAHQYVLGDRMFASHIDASFVSHQYIIAGQAHRAVDLPGGAWSCHGGKNDTIATLNDDRTYGPAEFPCFNYTTLGDELDAAGLPWRYYGSQDNGEIWIGYRAVKHIIDGQDAKNIVTPPSQFLIDVANGQLGAMTWVTPTCADSDHAACTTRTGPAWVASVVNAVGQSQFWNSTTIFVMWDEWGGWYDHVSPPYLDYDGLGFRVPLLVISPYAKQNYVSHVQYEHGSLLRYVEDTFGLARMAASDARANSPAADCFNFSQPPRTFVPIQTQRKARDFLREPRDTRSPDAE